MFNLSMLGDYAPALLRGMSYTLLCWAGGSLGAAALGFVVVLCRLSGVWPLAWASFLFIEAVRGTPPLLLAFFIYGGGPSFGLVLEPLQAGILTLTIHGSAYMAELYRAGFGAVPRGHVAAAQALGMTPFSIFTRVQLPEALVAIAPSLVNAVIVISKETAVLSIISVPELTYEVQKMSIESFAPFESLAALALGYWLMVTVIAKAGVLIERRVTRHAVRTSRA